MGKFLENNEFQAVEDLIVDTQDRILALMEKKAMRPADLARAMKLSRARVSQLFDENPNLTLATLARIFYALGETPVITSRSLNELFSDDQTICSKAEVEKLESWVDAFQQRHPRLSLVDTTSLEQVYQPALEDAA